MEPFRWTRIEKEERQLLLSFSLVFQKRIKQNPRKKTFEGFERGA